MKFSLVVTQGSSAGKELPISKTEFVIGRDAGCQLRPASQHVSKKHCALRIRGEQAFVEDFKSTNGTFINDTQVVGEKELHDGDHLKVGPLEFVVKLNGVAQPTHVQQKTPVPPPSPRVPPPSPKPAAAPKPPTVDAKADALDDDAVGSMLLSLTEEEAGASNGEADYSGSTLMQVLNPDELEELKNATEKAPYRPQNKQAAAAATSSSAAKAILEKYRRRPKA